MKLDGLKRRVETMEAMKGRDLVVVEAGAPDREEQVQMARERGLTIVIVDRDPEERA